MELREQIVNLRISNYHDEVSAYKKGRKYFICIKDSESHWGDKEISKKFFLEIQKEFNKKTN